MRGLIKVLKFLNKLDLTIYLTKSQVKNGYAQINGGWSKNDPEIFREIKRQNKKLINKGLHNLFVN